MLIYSYPGVSGGLEITSDVFAALAKHPNIVGVKQTDHLVGKMARNVWLNRKEEFMVFAGGTDYLIGGLAVGGHGAITGMANVTPRLVIKLMKLYEEGEKEEALELQGQISAAEWAILTGGVPAFKVCLYAAVTRTPQSHCIPVLTDLNSRLIGSCANISRKRWSTASPRATRPGLCFEQNAERCSVRIRT